MQKITTFLTFNNQAEEAANLYKSIFKNSKINRTSHFGDAGPDATGTVISVAFELDGQEFIAMNGGAHFRFAEGTSLFVSCETEEEVDMFWEKLSAGGQPGRCGWLKDKFGVSWQIVPTALGRLLADKDPGKARRVMEAMMQMNKLDIRALEQA